MCSGSRLGEGVGRANVANCDARRLPRADRARQQRQTLALSLRVRRSRRPVATLGPPETRKALAANSTASAEPEVRKAKPVTKEELTQSRAATDSPPPESGEQNRVAIQPLKRTYVRVTLGDDGKAAFERWVSPADGPVEFRGKHVSIRVLDPEAVKITKNGQELQQNDQDVTVN